MQELEHALTPGLSRGEPLALRGAFRPLDSEVLPAVGGKLVTALASERSGLEVGLEIGRSDSPNIARKRPTNATGRLHEV